MFSTPIQSSGEVKGENINERINIIGIYINLYEVISSLALNKLGYYFHPMQWIIVKAKSYK